MAPPYVFPESDGHPRRPSLPPLLLGAGALWGAAALCYPALDGAPAEGVAVALVAALGLLLGTGILRLLRMPRVISLIALFAALGCLVGCGGALGLEASMASVPESEEAWTVELLQDTASSELSSSAVAMARDGEGRSYKVRVVDYGHRELLCKERLQGSATLGSIPDSQAERAWQEGTCGTLDLSGFQLAEDGGPFASIVELRKQVIGLFHEHGGPQAGMLCALVCGNRSLIQSDGTYERFKTCGLAHIIAVSGAHLAIVAMLIGCLMGRCPRWSSVGACLGVLGAYLVFAGMPISALRAAAMVLLSSVSWIFARRAASLNACAICIIAFIVCDPAACLSVSLFLSAGSTLGIILFAPLVTSWLGSFPGRLGDIIGAPLSLTVSSNVMTQPFSVALFSQMPLISLLANILATPLFTLSCILGVLMAVASCVAPPVAPGAIALAAMATMPLGALVEALSSVPFASIPVSAEALPMVILSLGLASALWVRWPRIPRALGRSVALVICALPLIVCLVPPSTSEDEVVMVDVGQGDALLVQSGGKRVLIDTGNADAKLRSALGELGVWRIDGVLITHPDDDHCGSLPSLVGYVDVGCILVSDIVAACPCRKCSGFMDNAASLGVREGVKAVSVGERIEVGSFSLSVLWPLSNTDDGGNSDSLVLLAETDADGDGAVDWRTLFTGDAERDELASLIEAGAVGDIDVLKVGHHGSKVALSEEAVHVLRPELALISVGATNRYGHPSPEALSVLAGCDAQVVRTDEEGMVKLKYNALGIDIECTSARHLTLMRDPSE